MAPWNEHGADASAAVAVPAHWPQEACEILEQTYMRATGVPACLTNVAEQDIPVWLWRRTPDGEALARLPEDTRMGGERSARQVFDRIAGAWTYCGWKCGYFDSEDDARAFFDEIRFMLCNRVAAPDATQWRSTGLYWAYGITPRTEAGCITDYRTAKVVRASGEHLPAHGAFIHDVNGDVAGEGGILDLWRREARLLGDGLDTASNVSCVADGGGQELLRHLRVGDSAACALLGPSGPGPGRMTTVDADHPAAVAFAQSKTAEQRRSAALASGSRLLDRQASAIRDACRKTSGKRRTKPGRNPALRLAIHGARAARIPDRYADLLVRLAAEDGGEGFLAFDGDRGGETFAAGTSGVSRHVVRIPDRVLTRICAQKPGTADIRNGADRLWHRLAEAAWSCGGTGILFETAADRWNTCPESGAIRSSAAGADYLFLDDTACGRAVLNLTAFGGDGQPFDVDGFAAAVRLWAVALDVSVMMTAMPTPRLAARSWEFRPLGLGVTNLAGLLMSSGIAYDSAEGRALCAAVSALMTGTAYAVSAEMAQELGQFPAFRDNCEPMLTVIRRHRRAAKGRPPFEAMRSADAALGRAVRRAWDRAIELGEAHGFRNAQVTLITSGRDIAMLMDHDGTGIAPDFAMTRFERLPGGGYRRVINRSVPGALEALGYDRSQIDAIVRHVVGHGTLETAPGVNHETLSRRGFDAEALEHVEGALDSALDIGFVFNPWTLGEMFCLRMLGLTRDQLDDAEFDILAGIGFSNAAVEAANAYCCGANTLEGAPHLAPEHLAVFDCPRPQGARGRRFLSTESQIRMMAAAQPFVSGAVGQRVELPKTASVEDCRTAFRLAWRRGLKILVLDREDDGLEPRPADMPAATDGFAEASIAAAAAQASGDMPEATKARGGFLIYDGGLARAASAADKAATGAAGAAAANTGAPMAAPVPASTPGMSQALAIAWTARELASRKTASDGANRVNRTCSEGGQEKSAPAAETPRRSASDAARSAASVPSSADAVVEQRQV